MLRWQERVGLSGETLQRAKFRSVRVGHEGPNRTVSAGEDDDRIMTVGAVPCRIRLEARSTVESDRFVVYP